MQDIGSDKRFFTAVFTAQLAGPAVQPHGREYSELPIAWMLGYKTGRHARENIARASGCQCGTSSRVHPYLTAGKRDDRAVAFQNEGRAGGIHERFSSLESGGLHLFHRFLSEAAHLSRMRCQDTDSLSFELGARECIECIGID